MTAPSNAARLQLVPPSLANRFAPATHCLYEWTSYRLEYHGADHVHISDDVIRSVKGSLFEVGFENQLGLSQIQPFAGATPLCPPLIVEVLSSKFLSPDAHLEFYIKLLDDLFLRACSSRSPRPPDAPHACRPPTPLLALHYLCAHSHEIGAAIATVLDLPNRQHHDHPRFFPIHQASEADAGVLIGIHQSSAEWFATRSLPLSAKLRGRVSRRVWQRRNRSIPRRLASCPTSSVSS